MGRNVLSGHRPDERSSESTSSEDARKVAGGVAQQSITAVHSLPANMATKTLSCGKSPSLTPPVGQTFCTADAETLSGVITHPDHTTSDNTHGGLIHRARHDSAFLMPSVGFHAFGVHRFRGTSVEQSRPTWTRSGSTFTGFQASVGKAKDNMVLPLASNATSSRVPVAMPAHSSAVFPSPAVFSGHPVVPLPCISPIARDEPRRAEVQTKKLVSDVSIDAPIASPDHSRLNSSMQPRLSVHGFYAGSRPLKEVDSSDVASHIERKASRAFSQGVCNSLGCNVAEIQHREEAKNLPASGSCPPGPYSSKLAATQRSVKSLLGTIVGERNIMSANSPEPAAPAGPSSFYGVHLSAGKLLAVPEGDVLTPLGDSSTASRRWMAPQALQGASTVGCEVSPHQAPHHGRADDGNGSVGATAPERNAPRVRKSRLGHPPIVTPCQPEAALSMSSALSSSAPQHSWGDVEPGSGGSLLLSVFEGAERSSGAVTKGGVDTSSPYPLPATPEALARPALPGASPQALLSGSADNRKSMGACRQDVFCKLGRNGAVEDGYSRGTVSSQELTPVGRDTGRRLPYRSDAGVSASNSSGSSSGSSSLSDTCSLISMSSGDSPSPSSSDGISLTLSLSASSGSAGSGSSITSSSSTGLRGGSSSCSRIPLQGEIPRKAKLRGLRSGSRSKPSVASKSTVDDPPHGAAARKQRQREALLRRSLVGFYEESLLFDCLPHSKAIPGFTSMLTVSSPDWSPPPVRMTFPVSFPPHSPSRLYVAAIPVAASSPSGPPSHSSAPSSPQWTLAGAQGDSLALATPPVLPFSKSSSCGGRISTHIAGCDSHSLTRSDSSCSGRSVGAATCSATSRASCCPDRCCSERMAAQAACRPAANLQPRTRQRVPFRGQIQVVLSNPEGTPVHTFCCAYNLADMPPNTRTFVRQRTVLLVPATSSPPGPLAALDPAPAPAPATPICDDKRATVMGTTPVTGAPKAGQVDKHTIQCSSGTRVSPSPANGHAGDVSGGGVQLEQRAMIHLQFRCLPPAITSSSSTSNSSNSSSYRGGHNKPRHLCFSESCLEGLASSDSCDSIDVQNSTTGDMSSPLSSKSEGLNARVAESGEAGEERADRLFLWGAVRVIFPMSASNAQDATVAVDYQLPWNPKYFPLLS